jgi:hypothetical protein
MALLDSPVLEQDGVIGTERAGKSTEGEASSREAKPFKAKAAPAREAADARNRFPFFLRGLCGTNSTPRRVVPAWMPRVGREADDGASSGCERMLRDIVPRE